MVEKCHDLVIIKGLMFIIHRPSIFKTTLQASQLYLTCTECYLFNNINIYIIKIQQFFKAFDFLSIRYFFVRTLIENLPTVYVVKTLVFIRLKYNQPFPPF